MGKGKYVAAGMLALAALAGTSAGTQAHTQAGDGGYWQADTSTRVNADTLAATLADTAMAAQGYVLPEAFRACIRAGTDVHVLGTFVGRECVAADGEHWYAGLVWVTFEDGSTGARLQTGP
jgi:hypothetical protein